MSLAETGTPIDPDLMERRRHELRMNELRLATDRSLQQLYRLRSEFERIAAEMDAELTARAFHDGKVARVCLGRVSAALEQGVEWGLTARSKIAREPLE